MRTFLVIFHLQCLLSCFSTLAFLHITQNSLQVLSRCSEQQEREANVTILPEGEKWGIHGFKQSAQVSASSVSEWGNRCVFLRLLWTGQSREGGHCHGSLTPAHPHWPVQGLDLGEQAAPSPTERPRSSRSSKQCFRDYWRLIHVLPSRQSTSFLTCSISADDFKMVTEERIWPRYKNLARVKKSFIWNRKTLIWVRMCSCVHLY